MGAKPEAFPSGQSSQRSNWPFHRKTGGVFQPAVCAVPWGGSRPTTVSPIVTNLWHPRTQASLGSRARRSKGDPWAAATRPRVPDAGENPLWSILYSGMWQRENLERVPLAGLRWGECTDAPTCGNQQSRSKLIAPAGKAKDDAFRAAGLQTHAESDALTPQADAWGLAHEAHSGQVWTSQDGLLLHWALDRWAPALEPFKSCFSNCFSFAGLVDLSSVGFQS